MKEYVFYVGISADCEKREEFVFPDDYSDMEIQEAYEEWLWNYLDINTGYWEAE